MRLLCLRTVFRPPVITIGGNVITADRIQSARLIRTAENMPIKGIVQSELIVALKTDLTFEPNALVTVKTGGEDPLEFSEHFISRISRRGGLLEIHAMDRMRVTENDFDDSLYNRSNEPYVLSLVLADLASQCGFAGFSFRLVQHRNGGQQERKNVSSFGKRPFHGGVLQKHRHK